MNHWQHSRSVCAMLIVVLTIALTNSGCSKPPAGPPSVKETSAARAELTDRIRFVETYVRFKRTYEKLDYDIMYQNNSGGMVPGPSDWDVRLVAVVPAAELDKWIPANAEKSEGPPPAWLTSLPGDIERDGIREWHRQSRVMVGLDRAKSIVAYRNLSTPE